MYNFHIYKKQFVEQSKRTMAPVEAAQNKETGHYFSVQRSRIHILQTDHRREEINRKNTKMYMNITKQQVDVDTYQNDLEYNVM